MDITFKCTNCGQELATEETAVGSEIQCPVCNTILVVPRPEVEAVVAAPPPAPPPAHEEKHFSVPVHEGPAEVLIRKSSKPLEVAAKESDKHLRIKCIRRTDCVEVGHDHFEQVVSDFLGKVGDQNVVSVNTFNYTNIDMGTRQLINEYGVLIVYKG